ncbi:MAG: T9SS type A sorting domain-containing protein [Bacteroidales bacterium]|nr:T9SS type A sorting domain-containing protein [Bacteroidales bacterium]
MNVFSSFRINSVDVISSDGQTLVSRPVNGNRTVLYLKELPNGSYFVHIHTSGQTTTKKLIIKR